MVRFKYYINTILMNCYGQPDCKISVFLTTSLYVATYSPEQYIALMELGELKKEEEKVCVVFCRGLFVDWKLETACWPVVKFQLKILVGTPNCSQCCFLSVKEGCLPHFPKSLHQQETFCST